MLYKSILSCFLFTSSLSICNAGDSIIVSAGTEYKKGFFHHLFFGKHYRVVWSVPVKVEVFDIGKEAGGLQPVKQGGNFQTMNLRLVNGEGKEFVLRSIKKDPSRAIPVEIFRKSLIKNIMRDQNSAENPYGAFIIPPLAGAAGVFHTNPRLVYIPYDERFGEYASAFGNTLALFEMRPDGDHSQEDNFGNSSSVVGTKKMFKKIFEDNDNIVDQRLFARSRLFDMLIGDWGRHEDQWRWASFDKKNGKLYKPIPRDRDHVFYKFDDGALNWLTSRFFLSKLQTFNYDFGNIKALNTSGNFLDTRFLNKLSLKDWLEIADSIKMSLTNDVIENAVKQWPSVIFEEVGEETILKLKSRRDRLDEAAKVYYGIMAREVEIATSDKHEKFIIQRVNNDETLLIVCKISREGNVKDTLFKRVFFTKETNEIKIYGLGGNDIFEVTGEVNKGIKLIIIGGRGEDTFSDHSFVKGLCKKTWIYDSNEGNKIMAGKKTKIKTTGNPAVHFYDRKGFKRERKKTEESLDN